MTKPLIAPEFSLELLVHLDLIEIYFVHKQAELVNEVGFIDPWFSTTARGSVSAVVIDIASYATVLEALELLLRRDARLAVATS